jgi:hypothetical protein
MLREIAIFRIRLSPLIYSLTCTKRRSLSVEHGREKIWTLNPAIIEKYYPQRDFHKVYYTGILGV